MTAVLDPPTDEVTDLGTERWEVQTTAPVVVSPGSEFLIVSHAEPDFGDLPVNLGDPQQLLVQMFNTARQGMDLGSNLNSAILFLQGEPVTGYVDRLRIENFTAAQAFRTLLARFVEQSTGIRQ